jgi:hypothetical protein
MVTEHAGQVVDVVVAARPRPNQIDSPTKM